MGVLTWSPLASGFLSGNTARAGRSTSDRAGRAHPGTVRPVASANTAKFEVVEQLVELAEDIGCSLPRAGRGLPVAHPAVTSVITGPRTMEQLDGLLKGAALTLDDKTLDRIDEIVPPGIRPVPGGRRLAAAGADGPARRRDRPPTAPRPRRPRPVREPCVHPADVAS